ncbi:arginase family protein, partial [Candidatus Bathyarchaeota archaeon]|nr:arginase family protein [Candidatus Bathyarchaeota archaeon]
KLHDLGDLHVSGNTGQTLERLEYTLKDLLEMKKTPVLLGGEHTITLGAMRAVGGKSTAVISLDAHMDLRSKFMDLTTSHTTFMRRVHEEVCPMKIVEVGIRAVCREELVYAKDAGIEFFTMKQIQDDGVESTIEAVKKTLRGCERTYLTIDMDVLDPAFASAVQNPEPDGMSMQTLLDLVSCLCDNRLVGFDLVEVTPPYDNGTTAIQAAKIIFEALCQIERARKS